MSELFISRMPKIRAIPQFISIIGHRIDYNRVGALRGQRHIPSKK